MHKFHIHTLSRRTYSHTVVWSVVICFAIVVAASFIGRAAHNFKAALTDKPDVALYLLLPDEEIGQSTLLREQPDQRDYLAQTKDGPEMITLKRGPNKKWFVSVVEPLHE